MARILITGGAGFIGKHLALSLSTAGHNVAVFDSLCPQVHADPKIAVAELRLGGVGFLDGNVLDVVALTSAISTFAAEIVVHLAAETGTGQSYDLPGHYCDVNVTGTARLIEALRAARVSGARIRRVILAGSRAVYGEGACCDAEGRTVTAVPRKLADLAAGDFAPKCAQGKRLKPIPSSASSTVPAPASIYASSKLMQEYLLRQGLEHSDVEVAVLRLQNVYGVGQSLNNPYTGVLSIFAKELLLGRTLSIYEDGNIVRDFVYISDVVAAFHRLCEMSVTPFETLDIGSGKGETIRNVASILIQELGVTGNRMRITGQFRPGDVRHAVASTEAAKKTIQWTPKVELHAGISCLAAWSRETA